MLNNKDETVTDKKDDNLIRQEIITIRPLTPTREAIELVVSQRLNDRNELTLPTITRRGKIDTYVESPQFALDYGIAWVNAAYIAFKWIRMR